MYSCVMDQPFLSEITWLLKGLIASESGVLTLKKGRLSFTTDKPLFDCPLSEVQGMDFPLIYFGAGFVLKLGGAKYKFSSIQPGNAAGGEYASIPEARDKGKRWKAALTLQIPK